LRQHTAWDVRLAHPGYARRLKQSPDKSDHDDAQLLADLVRVRYLPEVWLAPTETRELRRIVRYRQQLKRNRAEIKLQIRALLREERIKPSANAWTKAWRSWLEKTNQLSEVIRWILSEQLARLAEVEARMKQVELQLEKHTANDRNTQQLQQHSGIGFSRPSPSAEIGEFAVLPTAVVRFCGVTPCNASMKPGGRRTSAGRHRDSAVLIEAAHDSRTIRSARFAGQLETQAVQRGTGVANRWLRWLYHQMISVKTTEVHA
jgi:hypothetical protein